MRHYEQKTYKLYRKLNAYNDVVLANYTFTQLSQYQRNRIRRGDTVYIVKYDLVPKQSKSKFKSKKSKKAYRTFFEDYILEKETENMIKYANDKQKK